MDSWNAKVVPPWKKRIPESVFVSPKLPRPGAALGKWVHVLNGLRNGVKAWVSENAVAAKGLAARSFFAKTWDRHHGKGLGEGRRRRDLGVRGELMKEKAMPLIPWMEI